MLGVKVSGDQRLRLRNTTSGNRRWITRTAALGVDANKLKTWLLTTTH